jgi:hypothetical protein
MAANGVVDPWEVDVDMNDVELGFSEQIVRHEEAVQHLRVALEVEGVHVVVGETARTEKSGDR